MKAPAVCVAVLAALHAIGCGDTRPPETPSRVGRSAPDTTVRPLPVYGFRVVHAFPHDREAFTQGLAFGNGFLYEGTGLNGRSSIRQVELETGRVVRSRALADAYFGEGVALAGRRLVQLTYTSKVGFVYRSDTFDSLGSFEYESEGWGITHDGHRFIMSDGTEWLRMLDEESMRIVDSVRVVVGGEPLRGLNELEFVQGELFANVWPTFLIARIDPRTGRAVGVIDLRGILPREELSRVDVLNGIAFDPLENRLFVTGKFWPAVFEIELIPRT